MNHASKHLRKRPKHRDSEHGSSPRSTSLPQNWYLGVNFRPSWYLGFKLPPSWYLGVVLLLVLGYSTRESHAYSSTYNPKEFSRNVTSLLDRLLNNYDKRIRPGHGGQPTQILVNMNVRSMGPFSEREETYAMQLYMRQVWYDTRLRYNKTDIGRSEFSMNWSFAQNIWKPDTFFINGKKSYHHAITAPNMFLRLRDDGQLYMSMRLTVRASCIMHLRRFPLDTQICPLRMASYTYNSKEMLYRWSPKLVTVDSDVEIAQYKLADISTSEALVPIREGEEISTIIVKFHLDRLTGFYMLQVYVPCILIVCSSWVGFWITKKDAPGRVCLGVNNVLCMTKLGFGGRDIFPMVSHATALDYFVILCFWCTFATMIEYALINYLQRFAVATLNRLIRRRARLVAEQEHVERLILQGAGCINVRPSVHSSLVESFKTHLAFCPAATEAADTTKPQPDPKVSLLQAFKVSLSLVPGEAEKLAKVQMWDDEDDPTPPTSSPPEVESSQPTSHTPRLLQRLAHLKRRSSVGESKASSEESLDSTTSKTSLPSMKMPHMFQLHKRHSTAGLPKPEDTIKTEHETGKPCKQSVVVLEGIDEEITTVGTDTPSRIVESGKIVASTSAPDLKPPELASIAGSVTGIDSGKDPRKPPTKKIVITIWHLLIRKKYLMKNMTPDFELPNEEDLLDRFSIIDWYSRRIFPSFFTAIFSVYWLMFNYYISDRFPSEVHESPPNGLIE